MQYYAHRYMYINNCVSITHWLVRILSTDRLLMKRWKHVNEHERRFIKFTRVLAEAFQRKSPQGML
jgi:hypothetical protein